MRILGIILFITINIFSKEYYISFQYFVKNNILLYSNFNISPKLVKVNGKFKYLFKIKCKNIDSCLKEKDKIADKILTSLIYISSYDRITTNDIVSSTKLTFLPHIFDIIIKNGNAYFYIKGDE